MLKFFELTIFLILAIIGLTCACYNLYKLQVEDRYWFGSKKRLKDISVESSYSSWNYPNIFRKPYDESYIILPLNTYFLTISGDMHSIRVWVSKP